MNFWQRVARAFKNNPVAHLLYLFRVGQPQWSPRDLAAFSREGYQLNPYVFRAVELRANAIGGLRWIVVKRKANGEPSELGEQHPLQRLIRRPQPNKGGAAFLGEVESFLCIAGNAFVSGNGPVSGPNEGVPRELYSLRPDRMKITPGPGPWAPVAGYEYTVGAQPRKFAADEILHLRRFNPTDDFFGMSPLEPAGRSVDQNNAGKRWNVALLQNSAQPAGSFATDGALTVEQREGIMKQYKEDKSGPDNAGVPFFFEGGLKWTQQGLSPKDMDWLEGSRQSAREILSVLGVSPELVGDATQKTYSNYQEARKAFYQDTILPEADWIRDEFNAFLSDKFDGAELDYDRDAIEALREDRAQLWTSVGAAWTDGRVSKNEARQAMGYDTEPAGDFFLLPASAIVSNPDGSDAFPSEIPEEEPIAPEADPVDGEDTPEDDGSKGLRLTKSGRRVLQYKAIDRKRRGWMRAAKMTIRKRLDAQKDAIVDAVLAGTDPSDAIADAEAVILAQRPHWEKLYRSLYAAVGRDFAKDTLRSIKSDSGRETKANELPLVDKLLLEWVRKNSGQRITGILDTDLERVRRELTEGVRDGESIPQMAKRIEDYLDPIYANRAETVARTEIVSASSLGSQLAAQATGLPMRKTFLSTPGERTRESHAAADGQERALDEPYEIAGYQLRFPGDSSMGAPPEETISCRCSETFAVLEDE